MRVLARERIVRDMGRFLLLQSMTGVHFAVVLQAAAACLMRQDPASTRIKHQTKFLRKMFPLFMPGNM